MMLNKGIHVQNFYYLLSLVIAIPGASPNKITNELSKEFYLFTLFFIKTFSTFMITIIPAESFNKFVCLRNLVICIYC